MNSVFVLAREAMKRGNQVKLKKPTCMHTTGFRYSSAAFDCYPLRKEVDMMIISRVTYAQ